MVETKDVLNRLNAAKLVIAGEVPINGIEVAIFYDKKSFFGVAETKSESSSARFYDLRNLVDFRATSLIASSSQKRGAERAQCLLDAIFPDYALDYDITRDPQYFVFVPCIAKD